MSDQDNAPVQDNEADAAIQAPDELTQLKSRATLMGIQFHPTIGVEKLRAKIQEAIDAEGAPKTAADPNPATDEPKTGKTTAEESPGQMRQRLKREALALVRIRLTCMNPAKKEWDGEIITAGNNLIGTVKKFVPFHADEGWHVPKVILNVLRDRQCQVFYTERSKNGVNIRKGKLIKEFAIEVLPPLTPEELHDLAQRQAMAKSID